MEDNKKVIDVLNDLIENNNDRIEGYEKALKELKDDNGDLKTLFEGFIDQSRNIRIALGNEVQNLHGTMADGTSGASKLHRAWIDIKSVFTGHGNHAILETCEAGEDATQKAYKTAIETEGMPAFLVDMLTQQKADLRSAHNEVKALRDSPEYAN